MKALILFNLFRPFPLIFGDRIALVFGTKFIDFLLLAFALKNGVLAQRILYLVLAFYGGLALVLLGAAANGMPASNVASLDAVWEILRYGVCGVFAASVFGRPCSDEENRQKLVIDCIRWTIMLSILFILLRTSFLSELTDYFFWSGKFKTYGEFFRVFPFTPNPTWAALLLLTTLIYYREMRRGSLWVTLGFLCLIVATGSRTALVATAVYYLCTLRVFWAAFVISLVLLLAAYTQSAFNWMPYHMREFFVFIFAGFDVKTLTSFSTRLDIWAEIWPQLQQNLLFGVGPLSTTVKILDNQYLIWTLYYGVAGLLLLLAYFFMLFFWVPVKHYGVPGGFAAKMLLTVGVASMAGQFFMYTQLMFACSLYLGAVKQR